MYRCRILRRFLPKVSLSQHGRNLISSLDRFSDDCNNAIAISALSDWLKNRTPVFNQSEAKPKPIAPCTRVFFFFFARFEQVTGNRLESDWFIALFAPAAALILVFRQSFENRCKPMRRRKVWATTRFIDLILFCHQLCFGFRGFE